MQIENPYIPANLARDKKRAEHWQRGYDDAKAGKGLVSANGAWLEGWHAYHEQKKSDD